MIFMHGNAIRNMPLDFYVWYGYVLTVPQGTKRGLHSESPQGWRLGVKEAVVKNRRAKRLFWLAMKAALWGALSRLVGKLIEKLMS